MNKKSIILLSGGLDSFVSLACLKDTHNIKLALTFNYGQKSFNKELEASTKIANYYKIEHKTINLDWLKEITNTSLVSDDELPTLEIKNLDNLALAEKTAKAVWVPNRNGLFINIAAAFADADKYTHIIIGANKEEATTFKDNSKEFIDAINLSLKNSTNQNAEAVAPLIDYDKNKIIEIAIEKEIPFNLLRSCYRDTEKHCGECESCNRLKRALAANQREDLINLIF